MDRIINEYKDLNKNPIQNCGVTIGLKNINDYRCWKVSLLGPKDTSYNGGLFYLNIEFPELYPLKPPEVYFITPIYHANINSKAPRASGDFPLGQVSLSTLSYWNPKYIMREVIINTFALLYNPNPLNPYDVDISEELEDNRAVYEEKIKHFTKKYANPLGGYREYSRTEDWDFSI